MSDVQFFPLDIFMRRADAPDPQSAAEATGLTIICDEDAAAVGGGMLAGDAGRAQGSRRTLRRP